MRIALLLLAMVVLALMVNVDADGYGYPKKRRKCGIIKKLACLFGKGGRCCKRKRFVLPHFTTSNFI